MDAGGKTIEQKIVKSSGFDLGECVCKKWYGRRIRT